MGSKFNGILKRELARSDELLWSLMMMGQINSLDEALFNKILTIQEMLKALVNFL